MSLHMRETSLFRLAEALTDGRAVDADLVRQVREDAKSEAQLAAMRNTLQTVKAAGVASPRRDLTAQILARGRRLRAMQRASAASWRKRMRWAAGMACILFLAISASFSFGRVLEDARSLTPRLANGQDEVEIVLAGPRPEVLRKASAFSDALQGDAGPEANTPAARQWRMAQGHRSNLSAALAALERNPGSKRALVLAERSSERLVEAQRKIYEERPL